MISRNSLSLLQCSISSDKHIVIQPLALSCGHSICKDCLPSDGNFKLKCSHCDKVNKTDLYSSKESQTTKYLLKENLGYLLSNIYDRLKVTLGEIRSGKSTIRETLSLNIDFIKEEISVRIESLKNELDSIQRELLKELNQIKREIFLVEENKREIYTDYGRLESQMKTLEDEIKRPQSTLNEKTLLNYQKDLKEAQKLLERATRVDYELRFEPSSLKHELTSVGRILFKNKFSSILQLNEIFKLNRLCGWSQAKELKCVYRGARDGFSASAFHAKCDSLSNTLVLVKSESQAVFGGFTSQTWSPIGTWKNDPQAFLFLFKTNENTSAVKIKVTKAQYAIYPQHDRLVHFGHNGDLFIANNCNLNKNSFAQLNSCYALQNVNEPHKYLAGETNFKCEEIEVFHVL